MVDMPAVAAMSAEVDRPSRTSAEVLRLCSSEVGLDGLVSSSAPLLFLVAASVLRSNLLILRKCIQGDPGARDRIKACSKEYGIAGGCSNMGPRAASVCAPGMEIKSASVKECIAPGCSNTEPRAASSTPAPVKEYGMAGGCSNMEPCASLFTPAPAKEYGMAGGCSNMEPRAPLSTSASAQEHGIAGGGSDLEPHAVLSVSSFDGRAIGGSAQEPSTLCPDARGNPDVTFGLG